ncbi:TPA: superantigen-like protein SSL10 [Staphylococcus argenteus]|uniref:superantigen-like protein SSL10 n=1 Tax=Staphylococcus argenteus TaxID=985002 RepID=UPI00023400C7|nr:superantigen-like protein SSL10 [Staphylococcus argenteus]MBE2132286.1 superantigen-like protein SSL10 [Staphylococcus argenteus]PNY92395.1 superantigen-like protein SSL10 [Staphylococcus argenteus]CCE58230.1 exotoxin 4 [Staphylococcus argenteus]SUJ03632.1 exotoxin 4 [Staphylococcus argenteus]HDY9430245.1 superantigen-like protein SSL10 [Staphylococcus argenteus]
MEMKTLAKATLALGLLTTGTLTTETHSGHAKQTQKSVNKHDKEALHRYYTGNFKEMKNINALRHGKNNLRFKYRGMKTQVLLPGDEYRKYQQRRHTGLDVFFVQERRDKHDISYTVGGVTKTNKTSGFVSKPMLNVTKEKGEDAFVKGYPYDIKKEEISLKELDFKLRKHLIEKYGLYKTTLKDGRAKISLKDGSFYNLNLRYKLDFKYMGEVIDSKQIKNIEVNLK